MEPQGRMNAIGAGLALTGFALFATHDVVVKWLGGSFSAFQIVFFSVLFSFPLTTMLIITSGEATNLRPRRPGWSAIRAVASVITGFSAFYAFSNLPLAQVYAILFASPLLITLLSIPLLGEKVGARRAGAIIVGLIGVFIVLRPGTTELSWGHLAALVAAVCNALASVIMRKIGRDESAVALLIYPLLGNLVLMSLALPFVYEPMSATELGGQALLSVLAFMAMICMIAAYRRAEAAIVAPMQYSQILWATLFGMLWFDERLDWPTAIGAGVIIASGVFIVWREARGGGSTNTPVLRTRARPDTATYPRMGTIDRLREARNKAIAQERLRREE